MAYDKESFLAGIAAGRIMQSWPMMKAITVYAPFVITVQLASTTQVTISNFIWKGYKGVIEWGDGLVSDYTETPNTAFSIVHTYADYGTYRISVWYSDDCPKYDSTKTLFPDQMFFSLTSVLVEINTPYPKIFEDIISFSNMCNNCSALQKIPKGLFRNTKKVTNLYSCFAVCSALTSIPEGLFDGLAKVENARQIFGQCESIPSIPDGLFDSFTEVTDLGYCFNQCTSITTIPERLFINCRKVTDFARCFSNCAITSIPEGLFDNCPEVTTFNGSFRGTRITSISGDIFLHNTKARDFAYCFYQCRYLTTIPSDLFAYCSSNAYAFNSCFSACSALTAIPDGLFDHLQSANQFDSCFRYCLALVYVPFSLFANCPSANQLWECFYGDSAITSSVPDLWNTHPSSTHSWCYRGCTHAANYNDIPSDWK